MERFQFWIFLGLGIVFGLSFELMKETPSDPPELSQTAAFVARADESRVRHEVSERLPSPFARAQARRHHLGGLENSAPGESSDAATPPPSAAKPDSKKDDSKKKADEKKKKKISKKKNKKKKIVRGSKPKPPRDTNDDSKETAGDGDESDSSAMSDMGSPVYYGAPTPYNPDAIPQTIEEWVDYLLPQPDFQRTTRFIKLYQTGVVTPDIYYSVLESMLEDSRERMRQLGVLALGSAPSVKSFSILTALLNEESPGSSVRSQIQVYLTMYTQLQHLRYLAGALNSQEHNAANLEALRLLQISAENHLKKARPSQPSEQAEDPGRTRTPATSKLTRYFDTFVPVLTRLTQSSPDNGVRQSASETLTSLQSLLQSTST